MIFPVFEAKFLFPERLIVLLLEFRFTISEVYRISLYLLLICLMRSLSRVSSADDVRTVIGTSGLALGLVFRTCVVGDLFLLLF